MLLNCLFHLLNLFIEVNSSGSKFSVFSAVKKKLGIYITNKNVFAISPSLLSSNNI